VTCKITCKAVSCKLSCKSFFDHLVTLQTKSLLLPSERQRLENTVQHLYEEIDCGLSKINVLEQEIHIFTRYKREIRENKDAVFSAYKAELLNVKYNS
jgi:REP element-mobilizing transposase RayT